MRSFARSLAVLPVVLALSGAFAGAALAAAPPTDANLAEAKEHYKRASTLFDLGKYDDAIKEFEAAFELKDDPVFLFNIAQSYRLSNRYPESIRFYRTYLKRAPKAKNRQEVEQRIIEMEAIVEQQKMVSNATPDDIVPASVGGTKHDKSARTGKTAATKPATPSEPATTAAPVVASTERPAETTPEAAPAETKPEPADVKSTAPDDASTKTEPSATTEAATQPLSPAQPPKPGRTKVIAGIALAVAGLAIAGGGVGMGMLAIGKAHDQEVSPVYDADLAAQGKLYQNLGLALDAVGGAAAVTGIVLAVLGARENAKAAERAVTVLPTARPGYAGATLHVRF